jgi:hypothetical protein
VRRVGKGKKENACESTGETDQKLTKKIRAGGVRPTNGWVRFLGLLSFLGG